MHLEAHFTNCQSFFRGKCKFVILCTIPFRCFTIIYLFDKFHQEVKKLEQTSKEKSYRETFTGRCVKRFSYQLHVPRMHSIITFALRGSNWDGGASCQCEP